MPTRLPLTRGRWAVLLLACGLGAGAQAAIYTCVDAQGRRLTSDRPIPDCQTREQRLLNNDGSTRKTLPPSLTAEEQAIADQRERREAQERAAQLDAARRDRNLLLRYPDEAAHQKAREAALDDVARSMRFSENRLVELQRERKPVVAELEFYAGKAVPYKLRQQLDANDAATAAQRELIQNRREEMQRIEKLFDQQLMRLKKMWAGARPGTLEMAAPASAPAPRSPR